MNPDGVSYLDIGDQYWRGNWHDALNAYWSPLYSWLTGLLLRIATPSIRWEFPEVHLLNFGILVATLFCFEFFWRELLSWAGAAHWAAIARQYAWIIGYLLFAFAHFFVVPSLQLVTPDLVTAALVYVIAAMTLRFIAGQVSIRSAALFGCLLGIGYLSKTAMLPFGVLVLAMMFAVVWRVSAKRLMVPALLGFLIISVPYIVAISWNNHRFTYGDSGKLNVAWLINGASMDAHLQAFAPGHAMLNHPLRKPLDLPELYEFATPIAGTYPPWYDPTYWNDGVDTHMHALRTLAMLRRNLVDLAKYLFLKTGFVTAVVLFLFLQGDPAKKSTRNLLFLAPIAVPACAMLFIFTLLSVDPRYFIAENLVLWGVLIASAHITVEEQRTKVLRSACFALVPMVVCLLPPRLIETHHENEQFRRQILMAEALRSLGIDPGEHVALIGDGLDAYWARLDDVKIVAEVPGNAGPGNPANGFWNSTRQRRQMALDIFKTAGAEVAITQAPPTAIPPGWLPVGSAGIAVHFLR